MEHKYNKCCANIIILRLNPKPIYLYFIQESGNHSSIQLLDKI